MSFSRARLQRFNENENNVPPPGAYDPKFDVKIKGLVIEKTERFQDSRSVASAECNLSVSSKSTGNVIASFKTPELPRKKLFVKQPLSCSKVKTYSHSGDIGQKLKYDSEHQLADLQVECMNKGKTILELEKHIEDMKEEVRELEIQLDELRKKQTEVGEQHRKNIEAMAELQQQILNDHDEKHQTEMETLRCQLLKISDEKECEIRARKTIEGELQGRIAEFSKRVATLESELAIKKEKKDDKVRTLQVQIEELKMQLDKLNNDHSDQVSLLEEEKSQLNLDINNLVEGRTELETKLEKRQNVILELQAQLSALQCELDELKAEYENLIKDSSKQMTDLTSKHEEEFERLKVDYENEKQTLLNENQLEACCRLEAEAKAKEFTETNSFLRQELHYVQELYKDLSSRLKEAHKELEDADKKHNLVLKKHKEDLDDMNKLHNEEKLKLEQLLEGARLDYVQEIENLTMARNKEIAELKEMSAKKIEEETKRMKDHAHKMVENAEAVTRETLAACRAESEERVKKVIAESDAKVNAMIRDARTVVEEEMRLTAERYKACLARVEIERAALDEKLAQRDAEITRLAMTLEELKSSAETQESFGQSLQIELDRAETELAEKKEELRALKDQIRAEAHEMVARRKRFEVIMAENQASVTALSKRLAQSNAEVERLQYELKRGEDCIPDHRDLLHIMYSNSQMVQDQVHALMQQLDTEKGLVDQLEANSLTEVKSMKSLFEAKIEDLREVAAKEIARVQAELDKKNTQNEEMKIQLDEVVGRLKDAQNLLLKLEENTDAQLLKISQVELLNSKLKEKLKICEKSTEETKNLLQTQSAQHKIDTDEANLKIEELSNKIKRMEEKEHHVQDKTELFEEETAKWKTFEKAIMEELEAEKARREAAEEEAKKLTECIERLKKDYQEISEKYVEVVGHQNHRQRIKHVSQLKDKISHMEQDIQIKSRTIEQQQKLIDKLRAEKQRAHSKGKENMLGISKSAHTTPVSSPHKPLTPLRNRND